MNYSRLATYYHYIERCTMGGSLQMARTGQLARLAEMTSPQRVLIVGEGDGSFLITFVRQFPTAQITVVESSAGMVARARARLNTLGLLSQQIVFITQPLLDTALPQSSFDLIVTLFFFDNFEQAEVTECISKLESCAGTGAYWLVSDFCLPEAGWRRWRARVWLWALYCFFGATTQLPARQLPDAEHLFLNAGIKLLDRKSSSAGMLYSSLYRV